MSLAMVGYQGRLSLVPRPALWSVVLSLWLQTSSPGVRCVEQFIEALWYLRIPPRTRDSITETLHQCSLLH
uniref:Putative secreted protein n=1 Tax=Anopheles marajoara TaxID=58244 RepID=A0A2M4CE73_9DIPT